MGSEFFTQIPSLVNDLVGTKDIVLLRRKMDAMIWFTEDVHPKYKQLYIGSRGEGFYFTWSDNNVMYVDRETTVVNSTHDVVVDDTKTVLLMRRDGCQPGFVTLQLLNNTLDKFVADALVRSGAFYFGSSILFRDLHLDKNFDQIGHGPSCTVTDLEIDMAYCFACTTWPKEAAEFISRPRKYGWPSQLLIKKITQKGCHVVAIGDRDSNLASIQWRISFAAAEKTLVHTFTHKQMEVYGSMKVFLEIVTKDDKILKGLLSSYFLKKVLFFAIESTQDRFWICNSTIQSVSYCFLKLIDCIKTGICPNYFVPENNMFRSKVHGQNRYNLLSFFRTLEPTFWRVMEGSQQFSVDNSLTMEPPIFKLTFEMQRDVILFGKIVEEMFVATGVWSLTGSLTQCYKLLYYARTSLEKDVAAILLHYCLGAIAVLSTIKSVRLHGSNRSDYHMIKNQEEWLKRCLCADFSRGKLTLATFYFRRHEYRRCIDTCERLVSRWRPETYYHIPNLRWIKEYVNDLSLADKAKRYHALDIIIYQESKAFFPCELLHDLDARKPYVVIIPPLPYAVFLLFLCHHAVGHIDESLRCIHDLRSIVQTQCSKNMKAIVLNLLAICLRKVGDLEGAVKVFMESMRERQEENGANLLLNDIVSGL